MENNSELIRSRVRAQYEAFPYPKLSVLGRVVPSGSAHASYEAGRAIVSGRLESHARKTICLVGCGTIEPYVFGLSHPLAQVTAVDFSAAALKKAELICQRARLKNIEFVHDDLLAFLSCSRKFDYIHCYGVLHHLPCPDEGLACIAQGLAPEGFARLMVYSKAARLHIAEVQKLARLLGLTPSMGSMAIRELSNFIKLLPKNHPMRLCFFGHPERRNTSGFVDAFLNQCENPYLIKSLAQQLASQKLGIHAWDFSRNLRRLLDDASGQTPIEKIEWLEAFSQWPGNFTFWASKEKPILKKDYVVANPHAPGILSMRVWSPVLRQNIFLTPKHRYLLSNLRARPIARTSLAAKFQKSLDDLIQARFVLEVCDVF